MFDRLLVGILVLFPFTSRASSELPGASAPPSAPVQSESPAPVDPSPRLGVYFTARTFVGDDALVDFYGTVTCAGLLYSRRIRPGLRLTAAAGYGRRSVDAAHDRTFVQPNSARIELFPFEVGLRFGPANPGAVEMTAGVAVEGVWLRETLPPPFRESGQGSTRYSGFVPGARIALGPDWRLPWHELVLGGELSVDLMAGANDDDDWFANPTAISWRISLAHAL